MKKILLPFFLVAGCMLSSCEKEVTGFKLPEPDSKLLISSFISPQDTAVQVYVTRSVPNLGYQQPGSKPVENAFVSLSNGTQTRQLAFTGQVYTVDTREFPVAAGITYSLRVSVPGGETVEATCTVPQPLADVPSVMIDSLLYADNAQAARVYFLRLSWADAPGQENYYRPMGEFTREYEQPPSGQPPVTTRPVYWDEEAFLDDQGKDGDRIYSPKGRLWTELPASDSGSTVHLNAIVLHTDRHYYQYHRSVRLATGSINNPFAEPVLVYSNVTGGLGIFAGYNRTLVTKKLR